MRIQVTVDTANTLDGHTEKQHFTATGMLTRHGAETRIRYAEQGEGLEGVITTVTVRGRCVTIGRGSYEGLRIETGLRHVCGYPTAYGVFDIGVTGKRVHADVQGLSGHVEVCYTLDTGDTPAGDMTCCITYQAL